MYERLDALIYQNTVDQASSCSSLQMAKHLAYLKRKAERAKPREAPLCVVSPLALEFQVPCAYIVVDEVKIMHILYRIGSDATFRFWLTAS